MSPEPSSLRANVAARAGNPRTLGYPRRAGHLDPAHAQANQRKPPSNLFKLHRYNAARPAAHGAAGTYCRWHSVPQRGFYWMDVDAGLAETECETSNRVLEILEEWNDYLKSNV